MSEDTEQPEPEKPRFLLPDGCSDLVDALRLEQRQAREAEASASHASATPAQLPSDLPASVSIPDPVTVRDLASALHIKPYQIIAALIHLNIFAPPNAQLDFNTASALCSRYGVLATKVA